MRDSYRAQRFPTLATSLHQRQACLRETNSVTLFNLGYSMFDVAVNCRATTDIKHRGCSVKINQIKIGTAPDCFQLHPPRHRLPEDTPPKSVAGCKVIRKSHGNKVTVFHRKTNFIQILSC